MFGVELSDAFMLEVVEFLINSPPSNSGGLGLTAYLTFVLKAEI